MLRHVQDTTGHIIDHPTACGFVGVSRSESVLGRPL